MKTIIFLLILFPAFLFGQSPFFSTKKNGTSLTMRTVPNGAPSSGLYADPSSKIYKFSTPAVSDSSIITVYILKYKMGREIKDSVEYAGSSMLNKKERSKFEIIPEIQPDGQLKIFLNYLGSTHFRYKTPHSNNLFKWIDFQENKNKVINGTMVPLMLIYEEEKKSQIIEKKLENMLITNGLSFPSLKSINTIIKEYHLIVYTITK